MVYRLLLCVLICSPVLYQNLKAQNLIPDPGFEDVSIIFDGEDSVYQFKHWQSLVPFKKRSSRGRPIYSRYVKQAQDQRYNYFWSPYEGDAFFMAHFNHQRNLYQTKLKHPLELGRRYRVSFMYKVLADFYSNTKVENSINGKIGVQFTVSDMNTPERAAKYFDQSNHFQPQFAVEDYDASHNNFIWVPFEYVFEAKHPYQYLTVGNFTRILEVHESPPGNVVKGVTYRIDNVDVYQVADTVPLTTNEGKKRKPAIDTSSGFVLNFDQKLEEGLMQYYRLSAKAENFVLEQTYDSAYYCYKAAFQYKWPYVRDYRNAKAVQQLLAKSRPEILSENLIPIEENPKIDIVAARQVDSIFQLDQSARMNGVGIAAQDSANYLFVTKLLETKILSEKTMGINSMRNFEIILLHLSRYPNFINLLNALYKSVHSGAMDNKQFASLADAYHGNFLSESLLDNYYYTDTTYPVFQQFVMPYMTDYSQALINKKRALIGLESLEDQYRKQFYNFKNGYKDFDFYQFFTYFPAEEFCTEEEKFSYLEKEKVMIEELKQQYVDLIIWTK